MNITNLAELRGETVRFTVETEDGRTGTLAFENFNGDEVIGKTFSNIQTRVGINNVGYKGKVKKVKKIEYFDWRWKKVTMPKS